MQKPHKNSNLVNKKIKIKNYQNENNPTIKLLKILKL